MTMLKILLAGGLLAASAMTSASTAAPDATDIKAAHDLLASLQAEKMMRTTAGTSRYANPQQRSNVLAKLEKLTPEEIYTRLSLPLARILSKETAAEMTRFYSSTYGQRVLYQTYNHGAMLTQSDPVPTAKEKEELKRPEYLKANKAFKEAEPAIHHETFVLLSQIGK